VTPILSAGVIGANRHAKALARHLAPVRGLHLRRWAASPSDQDRVDAVMLAKQTHVPYSSRWQAVVEDPSLPAIVVLSDAPKRTDVVITGLTAGKIVLCPIPAAVSSADLDKIAAAQERGGGVLVSPSEIAHTEAGVRAIKMIADGAFGALHSLYLAIRTPRTDRAPLHGVLAEFGWEALDFLFVCQSAAVRQVYAVGCQFFCAGSAEDTAVIIMRLENNIIVTVELSRCLPPTIPAAGLGEVEVEAIGARQVVRIEPHKTSVRVYSDRAVAARPWVDEPIVSMLGHLVSVAGGTLPRVGDLHRLRSSVALMEAVRSSIASGRAVEAGREAKI
jgi:predicted dehydrogenase